MLIKSKSKEELNAENLITVENFRLIDDDFMRIVFQDDLELAQFVLRIITGIDDLMLTREETQYELKRQGSRAVCLDVHGVDNKGTVYDLEIQRSNTGAEPERARYHSSMIDITNLQPRKPFRSLPTSYVIFITENDVMGDDELVYEYERRNIRTGKPLNDRSHIIYVNTAYNHPEDKSTLAELARDFRCKRADDMRLKELADRVRFFKETEEGVSQVCEAIEKIRNEAELLKAYDIALSLLSDGTFNHEKIATLTGLSLEDVEELAKKQTVGA